VCDVDCGFTNWSTWTACSKTCGAATQTATRQVTRGRRGNGAECPSGSVNGFYTKQQDCDEGDCPVHCVVSAWELDGTCSEPCGSGVQQFKRSITTAGDHGGRHCPALTKSGACNTDKCLSIA